MQRRYIVSIAVLIVLIAGVWTCDHYTYGLPNIPVPVDPRAQSGLPVIAIVLPDGTRMAAEVVTTSRQQQKGVMFRHKVPPLTGMLFVYEEAKYQQIWMKNVSVNLDVVFIGKNKHITQIVENVKAPEPGIPDDEIRRVTGYGKYILELGTGAARQFKLEKGQCLILGK